MRTVVAHGTGNQNVRELLEELTDAQILRLFCTSTGLTRPVASAASISRLANRRVFAMLSRDQLSTAPSRELVRQAIKKIPLDALSRQTDTGKALGAQWVAASTDKLAARRLRADDDVAYGYLGQSTSLFRRATRLGVATALEAHHVTVRTALRLLENERHIHPEWLPLIDTSTLAKHRESGVEEIRLADVIISPSSQVTESIREVDPHARVRQIPYGSPTTSTSHDPISWDGKEPLRALFVGRMQPSKGIAYVAALQHHFGSRLRLRLVGHRPRLDLPVMRRLISSAEYVGAVDRSMVFDLMRDSHILVLPSLFEGRSLAVLEALGHGLPAIVTAGTGTDDVVAHGGGIVVETGSEESLIKAVESVLNNPPRIEEMSTQALHTAQGNSWANFRTGVRETLEGLVRTHD
ncbi:glycosyltransferase involved in cell wall biosynthesis [Microbacterium marinum]|uniref:Glycosyltransferase involved in cell wall biosynthesis n=1 Tax=Microbacterium marinum TaxID=421115 RepID=A0A7W7BR44_9MICO|nr:glycosyltransferase family 4 protein [Microbacterium marinum]MBB4666138.1 glycosyltransferase involved in cell wall biosynthesis [Microbacterium marinum]